VSSASELGQRETAMGGSKDWMLGVCTATQHTPKSLSAGEPASSQTNYELPPLRGLFDYEAKECPLSGAEQIFTRLRELDLLLHVQDTLAVDFHASLFDKPLGLAARGHDL